MGYSSALTAFCILDVIRRLSVGYNDVNNHILVLVILIYEAVGFWLAFYDVDILVT